MLTPAKITLRGEKNSSLTQEEMDNNLRILKAFAERTYDAYLVPVISPSLFTITGHTDITSKTATDGSDDNKAYNADPITITLSDWFDANISDYLYFEAHSEQGTDSWNVGDMTPSASKTLVIPASNFRNLEGGGAIHWQVVLLSNFRVPIGTYGTFTAK